MQVGVTGLYGLSERLGKQQEVKEAYLGSSLSTALATQKKVLRGKTFVIAFSETGLLTLFCFLDPLMDLFYSIFFALGLLSVLMMEIFTVCLNKYTGSHNREPI